MNLSIKIKTIIIIILFLNLLFLNLDFDLSAKTPNAGTDEFASDKVKSLSSEDFIWSQIEVISEPIFGQNFDWGNSHWPAIAIEGDKIYVVWDCNNDTNGAGMDKDIFYRYFDGDNWSKIQVISEPIEDQDYNIANSSDVKIAVENGNIYVVWRDDNNTNGAGTDTDIFYRCNHTGSGWEDIQVISEPVTGLNLNTENSTSPSIAVENGDIYIVWSDNSNGSNTQSELFYRCNLTGASWESMQIIGDLVNSIDVVVPDIAVETGKIYVVWAAGFPGGFRVGYQCNLTGYNWEKSQILNPAESSLWGDPSIAVENNKIYTVWCSNEDIFNSGTDSDVFYRSNLTGTNWEDIQVISEPVPGFDYNTGWCMHTEIAVLNGETFIVWCDNNLTYGSGFEFDTFLRCNLTGSSWGDIYAISEPIENNNVNTGFSYYPELAIDYEKCYIVWHDNNDTNGAGIDNDIFYRDVIIHQFYLCFPKVVPTSGNTSTHFNYTVTYIHSDNNAPTKITVNISGTEHSMLEVDQLDTSYFDGKNYFFNITHLDIGAHTYNFWAFDGVNNAYTPIFNDPTVYNTAPNITTPDNVTAIEDIYYEVLYEYEDIDRENVGQLGTWNCSTNASWLAFNPTTALLNGTPTNDDVGQYWINITINDTMEIDFTNFTLTVIDINDDPIITTPNVEITYEDELYEVDYNATDIDSPLDNQIWFLETNASSWLNINQDSGVISGTPTNDDVGSYWVNVSVNDTEGGFDFTNFTLIVLNVNDPPEIITEDVTTAIVAELYEVDYDAIDIDPPPINLVWSFSTNATWLNINSISGILNGTPALDDLGWYNVNITVDDNCGGLDWQEFILNVIKENLPPKITTEDVLSATVDELYNVDYNATDVDTPLDKLRWSLNTNASWLNIDKTTGILSGTPVLEDLGKYVVNVTITDEVGAFDFHNFTLTVYLTPNLPPRITTDDLLYAVVSEDYSIDYEAEDDRTPVDKLRWFLKSNASWLNINENTGLIYGAPELEHIGSYLINVSVFDGEDGWDWHVFILRVIQEPVDENNVPILSEPGIMPTEGDTETEFTFSVHYYDTDNDAPTFIQVVIDNKPYNMTLKTSNVSNGTYEYNTKLYEGSHTYYFTASDGIDTVSTNNFTVNVNKSGKKSEESSFCWLTWILIVIVIVVLILLFIFIKRKKQQETPDMPAVSQLTSVGEPIMEEEMEE